MFCSWCVSDDSTIIETTRVAVSIGRDWSHEKRGHAEARPRGEERRGRAGTLRLVDRAGDEGVAGAEALQHGGVVVPAPDDLEGTDGSGAARAPVLLSPRLISLTSKFRSSQRSPRESLNYPMFAVWRGRGGLDLKLDDTRQVRRRCHRPGQGLRHRVRAAGTVQGGVSRTAGSNRRSPRQRRRDSRAEMARLDRDLRRQARPRYGFQPIAIR